MNVKIVVIMLVAIMLTALIGCAAVEKTVQRKSEPIEITYEMPTLTPVEGSPQIQEKHEICISVALYDFSATRKVKVDRAYLPATAWSQKFDILVSTPDNWEERKTPYYEVIPDLIYFKVKVYNNLGHVLRLAGTVVSFQVDGKLVAIDKSRYEDFLAGIVLPRQEMEYVIFGPSIDLLPESCNIALLLYDIVTKADAAGNPTERTNFEWYYTFSKEKVVKSETVDIQRIEYRSTAPTKKAEEAITEAQTSLTEWKTADLIAPPEAEEILEKARKAQEAGSYKEVRKLAEESLKISSDEGAWKLAKKTKETITQAQSYINLWEKESYTPPPEAKEILKRARETYQAYNNEEAYQLARQSLKIASDKGLKKQAQKAKEAIAEAEAGIARCESAGYPVSEAKEILKEARRANEVGDYKKARKLAKDSLAVSSAKR